MRLVALALLLFAFWLLLSGHYTAWLVGAGVITAVIVAWLGRRFAFGDEEGLPIERLVGGLGYWPWLVKEVALASFAVARIILNPKLPISPRLVRAPCGPRTAVGIATFANSITLTPGTITIEVDRRRGELVVHALTDAGASDLMSGEMNNRVERFEGRP
jgi:multicomponent Na+:H+ antiporter subunit E